MTARKTPPAAWKPGTSGNPAGRPRGSLNKTTRAVLELLEGEAGTITRTCIEAAKGGDMTAIRLVLDRLVPPAKERPVSLPDLPDTSTARPARLRENQTLALRSSEKGDPVIEITTPPADIVRGSIVARDLIIANLKR